MKISSSIDNNNNNTHNNNITIQQRQHHSSSIISHSPLYLSSIQSPQSPQQQGQQQQHGHGHGHQVSLSPNLTYKRAITYNDEMNTTTTTTTTNNNIQHQQHQQNQNQQQITLNSSSPLNSPLLNSSIKKDIPKILKRSNTSSAFPKKDNVEIEKKLAEINMKKEMEKLKVMQQEIVYKQAKLQVNKFEKKVQQKRKILGNPLLAREERSRRKENHLDMIKNYSQKKSEFINKLDSTDGVNEEDIKPFPSVTTIESEKSSIKNYGIVDLLEKRPKSKLTVSSPFVSKFYRSSDVYKPKHFFEEDRNNLHNGEESPGKLLAIGFQESTSDVDDIISDEGTDIFASEPEEMSSSFSYKRSETVKFVDEIIRADSRSTILEPSLSMAETIPYDGNPNDLNYFGEEARKRFFILFNSLSKKFEMGHGEAITTSSASVFSRRYSALRPDSANIPRRKSQISQTIHQRPHSAQPRLIEEDDEDRDDPLDLSDDETPPLPLHSPRHRFLQLLIKDGKCAPLPIIIRHHPDDDELNLAHRTLGDDYIIYLSAVVQDLPNLTKLNLRDNRLTDRGMGKFIHTLANQQQIKSVDISENKIDSKSAEALTHFLKRKDCTLKVLKMSNADLDDDEVAIFMDALQMNLSILELDLSHNKLGGTGEKSVHLKSDNLTGGAAVAAALGANKTLQSLDLSWNKLGLLSAVNLEQALTINHTLLTLNLAYNTMRDEGAEAIGNSLAFNKSLTCLDLSHNSVGSIGAFVIATGLKLNSHLKIINLSGNPIGSYGGQALLRTLNYHSVEREIHMFNCSFDEESFSSTPKINLMYPTGKKTLDLSRPRNKCSMLELYHMASIKRGCTIKNIEYQSNPSSNKPGSRKKTIIKLIRPNNPSQYMGQPYGSWTSSYKRERHPYTLLDADNWLKIEKELYLHDSNTNKPWEIPDHGIISFDFTYVPRCATPIECLNSTGLKRLKKLLISHPKEFLNILKLCQNLVIETYQVEEILESLEVMGRTKEKMEVIAYLLLCVRDTSNVSSLFTSHIDELIQLKSIHQIMKNMFYISVNAFSGHYSLDLDNSMDRLAGVRLMEISNHENAYIYRAMPSWSSSIHHGFTSQKQNRTNFRNEYYRRMPLEKGCNDEFFSLGLEDKIHGVYEFDFVSICRPSLQTENIQDDHLEHLLSIRGLLNAAAAPIQNLKRRRKSRQSVQFGGSGDDANPFSMNYKKIPSFQKLTSFEEETNINEDNSNNGNNGNINNTNNINVNNNNNNNINDKLNKLTINNNNLQQVLSHIPRSTIQSIDIDPSKILGHFVVKKEHRLLPPELPISPEDLHLFLMSIKHKSLNDIREEDLYTMSTEMNNEYAMYYIDNAVDRFIINLSIRIVSKYHDNFFELISFIKKLNDGSHEAYGHGKADESDKPTKPSTLLEVLNLVNDLSNFEIGIVHYPNVPSLNPTHRKFIINEDIHILGNEIFVRLKCNEWTLEGVQDRAREVCAKLFSCIGVSKSTIRIVNHRTCDTKYSEFSYPKYTIPVSTHMIIQQIDVSIEGIPIDSSIVLKTYVYNGRVGDDTPGTAINTVWRWRSRHGSDRGAPKLDLNVFPNEFWGFKFLHLRTLIGSLWITSRQAARIVKEFPQFGYDGQPHRETAILCIFNRIIDLENFHIVLNTLPSCNHHTLQNRIGWQNVLNMYQVDRLFILDVSLDDDRNMAIMLAKVAQVEPGENFIEPKYRRTLSDMFIPGWTLPQSWTIDPDKAKIWDGVPRKGQVSVTYISNGIGRAVVPSIRKYFHEKYSLLAVPRDNGGDFYSNDIDPKLWE